MRRQVGARRRFGDIIYKSHQSESEEGICRSDPYFDVSEEVREMKKTPEFLSPLVALSSRPDDILSIE